MNNNNKISLKIKFKVIKMKKMKKLLKKMGKNQKDVGIHFANPQAKSWLIGLYQSLKLQVHSFLSMV